MRKKTAVFTLIIGLMVAVAILMGITKGRQPLDLTSALASEIMIEPTQADGAGVDISSQFMVKTSTYIDPKVVADNISIEPEVKFSVEEQNNANKIILIPEKELESNKVYRFTLDLPGSNPLKWAFQTKGEFKINGTLPHDKSTGVPTNTGIELVFSHANFEDIGKYFEISPKAKGHFERRKKTAVFVPDSLQPGTVYTVKVKKGLKLADSDVALSEDMTFQFETQDPDQHNQNRDYFEFFTNTIEFTGEAAPAIPLGYFNSDQDAAPEVQVSLYKYQDAKDYIAGIRLKEQIPDWAYLNRNKYLAETKGLSEVQTFTANLRRLNGETFLEFPQSLSPGYYLSEVTLGNTVRQIWLQVTDLAVYTSVGENKILVWVNNLQGGKPVVNARINLLDSIEEAVTNEKGIGEIKTSQIEKTGVYIVVRSEDKEAVVSVRSNPFRPMAGSQGEKQDAQDYWKYLYLDRGLYQPDDTINFWGLVKGRDKDNKTPDQLSVTITKWQEAQEVVVFDKQIKVNDHVFTGEVTLPNLIPGYYTLSAKVDDLIIVQRGFDVQTYTKPAYRILIEPEKKALFAGDTMEFKVSTTCFEETPVPNVKLKYNLDKSGELITDNEGQSVLSYTPEYRSEDYGPVQNRYLYLNANLPESGEISAGTSVFVLNNDIRINAEGKRSNKKGQITIQADKLTVDKVNRGEAEPWDDDAFIAGKASGIPVTVSVFRQEWDQVEDGEYYDFINKTVVKKYRYQERKVPVEKNRVITDRNGKANFSFAVENKKSYLVQLTGQDTKGNQTKTEIYLSGGDHPELPGYSWHYLDDGKSGGKKYRPGDEVLLTMVNNENPVPDRAGGFLFYTAQKGIMDYQVQDSGAYKGVFSSQHIPNYWVQGVYFDGKTYYEATEYLAAFDTQEKALQVQISANKNEYRPGEKVYLTVNVRDGEGRPVSAEVNLSLVDEALFMLSYDEVNLLNSLYGDFLRSGIIMTASTHKNPTNYYGGGAEQGGEGGSGRQDFKDTAFFETITTGRDGKGTASFTLPDNLTSWRLTYQAVTKELEGASGTKNIKVRLPFFVDMVLNNSFLSGDQPIVNIRSLGSELDENTEVKYQVRVKGKEEIYNERLVSKAFVQMPVQLPALGEGEYEITVTAEGAGKQDKLTRSFRVVKSYLTQEKVDYVILTGESKFEVSTNKPVTLTFTDANRSQYLSALCTLAYGKGSRIEHKLVPKIAVDLLRTYYQDFKYDPALPEENLASYQTQDGGIAVLPYGSSDLEVSSQIAPWAEENFDMEGLKAYFYNLINDPKETRERGIIALYGLASLGEPVLHEVEVALQEKDLNPKEQIYIILSLTKLGNEQPARKLLKEFLKVYGKADGPYMYINAEGDKTELVKISALAAIAGERLMFEEGNKLHKYVMENPPQDELAYLEQITFLQENLTKLTQEETGFTYILQGKKKNIQLAPGETFSLMLTPDKLKLLAFENIKGEVGVTSAYQSTFNSSREDSQDVSLAKDYLVAGKSTRQLLKNDLVEVKISWNIGGKAPNGVYRITDYLPSGLKAVEKPYQWGVVRSNLGWPVKIDGQRVEFLVTGKGDLTYYARVVNPGSFTGENSVIQHIQSGKIFSVTARDKVEIK